MSGLLEKFEHFSFETKKHHTAFYNEFSTSAQGKEPLEWHERSPTIHPSDLRGVFSLEENWWVCSMLVSNPFVMDDVINMKSRELYLEKWATLVPVPNTTKNLSHSKNQNKHFPERENRWMKKRSWIFLVFV